MLSLFNNLFPKIHYDKSRSFKVVPYIKHKIHSIKHAISDFFHHLKHLRKANIELGQYHLHKGHFSDAEFRFRITDKLFAPNDPENLYWLGFTYMVRKNYDQALKVLENNTHDKIGLRDFIAGRDSLRSIPHEISEQYETTLDELKYDRYRSEQVDLFEKFTQAVSPLIPTKDWNEKRGKYTVLEISSHPFWVDSFKHHLPEASLIDSVNFREDAEEISKAYHMKVPLYNRIFKAKDMVSAHVEIKYDCVIAFDCFSQTLDLTETLATIQSHLAEDGFFALVLPASLSIKLDPSMNHFTYTRQFIEENLKLANFGSTTITDVVIRKNLAYFIIISRGK